MALDDGFNDRQAIMVIKDSLQANLVDPRSQYTNSSRAWIHTDKPLGSATYPRIQIRKRGPTTTSIISEGKDFIEWRGLIVDIQFWTKAGFKWQDSTDFAWYQDEELVKEWLDRIWVALKAQQATLQASYGVTGLKPVDEEDAFLEPDSQLYSGIISVRLWYFRR